MCLPQPDISLVGPMKPPDESWTSAITGRQRCVLGRPEARQITGRHLITAAELNNGPGRRFCSVYLSAVLLACQMGTVSTIRPPW